MKMIIDTKNVGKPYTRATFVTSSYTRSCFDTPDIHTYTMPLTICHYTCIDLQELSPTSDTLVTHFDTCHFTHDTAELMTPVIITT